MKKWIVALTLFIGLPGTAHAEWVNISEGIDEIDVRFAAADVKNPKIIYASSERQLYRSDDEGDSWKRVLSVRGETGAIYYVLIHPLDTQEVYVATDKGVRLSRENGKKWVKFFAGAGGRSKETHCLAVIPEKPEEIYIGTAEGLFLANKTTGEWKKVDGFPDEAVQSILVKGAPAHEMIVATEKGLYRRAQNSRLWERVLVNAEEKGTDKETSLEQFQIEQVFTAPYFSNMASLGNTNTVYAGTRDGVFEAGDDTAQWIPKQGQNLPDKKVNAVACSADTVYVATDQGVFRAGREARSYISMNEGLGSKKTNHIFYNPGGDYLIAATKKGLFRYHYPELKIEVKGESFQAGQVSAQETLNNFKDEPSIKEIHQAAIRYAEVHPGKIEGWRRSAAIKALLPSLSLDGGVATDENIDLDRGGTGDPDKFIFGPKEKSYDWSVGLNWDLGELIWNDDQTGIDTRSKLMVELREDILNEVTHLYYERRRLQVEIALNSSKDLKAQVEREIRFEELTAGIDALTGGYFSDQIQARTSAPNR